MLFQAYGIFSFYEGYLWACVTNLSHSRSLAGPPYVGDVSASPVDSDCSSQSP